MSFQLQHLGIYCKDIDESIRFYETVLGFKHLFSTSAMEGDKPLKMAWIKNNEGVVIELLESVDKSHLDGTAASLNHVTLRVQNMDETVALLKANNVQIEAGPFDAEIPFDRDVKSDVEDVFSVVGSKGLQVRILFFRGPANERFEVMEDSVGALN